MPQLASFRALRGMAMVSMVAASSIALSAPQQMTLYLIGDSTMANKPDPEHNPERGWGQALPALLDGAIKVDNHAVNGRSTKSFINEGRWSAVRSQLHKGDVVIIQFGHNDEKREDTTRFGDARGAYHDNLALFVRETRAAGATPILMTPIARRSWTASGALTATHGEYPDAVRALAVELGVPVVDMERLTSDLLKARGVEPSKQLFVWTRAGEFPAFPAARQDNTHLSPRGAAEVAALAANALRTLDTPLRVHVK
ncbi:MAG: rhamnogalacturonan acetylesterase [Gemmatimonas sp.]